MSLSSTSQEKCSILLPYATNMIIKRVLSIDLFIESHLLSELQNKDLYHNTNDKKMKF